MVYNTFATAGMYIAETTAYGNGDQPTTALGRIQSYTPNKNNSFFKVRGIGSGRNVINTIYGNFECGFSLSWLMHDFEFLVHGVGHKAGAGQTGNPWLLTQDDAISYTGNVIRSFSFSIATNETADVDDVYAGCVINDFTITATVGAILTCSANVVAKSVTSDTSAPTYTEVTTDPWVFQQGSFKWGAVPTAVSYIQSFSVTYNNNLQTFRSLGSRFIEKPEPGVRDITFSITCMLYSAMLTTLRDNFYGQANSPFAGITSASPTADLEIALEMTKTANYAAKIELDQCALDSMSDPVTLGGGLRQVTFTGHAKTGKSGVFGSWWTSA